MNWHVFVVFGAIFYACFFHIIQGASLIYQTEFRAKRSPQNDGTVFNLGVINLPQVASNVRKHLHNLIDTVTNPLNYEVMTQVDPMNVNYQYDYTDQNGDQQYPNPSSMEYQIVDQQYQDSPRGPPRGPPRFPHEHPPRGHHPRGPPHRHHPRGPPHRHPSRGPPHGHRPRGPPHRHPPRGPPYDQRPPFPPNNDNPSDENVSSEEDTNENINEGDTQNLPETRPDFSQQPNYPGKSQVNIDPDAKNTSKNLDEQPVNNGDSNIAGYIEGDFPVILLNENEIR